MSILKKRRIDYLTDKQYNDLKKKDPKTFKRLQEHQQNFKKVNARIEKLKRDEIKTKKLKEELKEWKSDLTSTYNDLLPLNEDFEFTLTLKKRKNSFHLNLSRGSKMPLKIHLGTRDKLIDRLTPLFPKENVKRNWYFIIKREIRFYFDPKKKRYVDGMIYEKVLDRIMKNPTGFHAETFNLENLLPPV